MATYSDTVCTCCGGTFLATGKYGRPLHCGICRMRCTPSMACTRPPDLTLVLGLSIEKVKEKKNG